jgi:hypothetical protein
VKGSVIARLTGTGDVTTHDAYLSAVVLTAAAAAASATVRSGGATGPVILTVKAGVEATAVVRLDDAFCGGGIHVTLAGAGAEVSVTHG